MGSNELECYLSSGSQDGEALLLAGVARSCRSFSHGMTLDSDKDNWPINHAKKQSKPDRGQARFPNLGGVRSCIT